MDVPAQNVPVITVQPVTQTVLAGGNAAFTVAVSGVGPFRYQWQFNGTDVSGIITTVAGDGTDGFSGDGGAATNASIYAPFGMVADSSGNLFIADQENNRLRKVGTNGIITTVAGNGRESSSGDGGPATNAQFSLPFAVAVDGTGNLFIADTYNNRLRRVGTNGIITTAVGDGFGVPNGGRFAGDGGAAANASLYKPKDVIADGFGNLFIADSSNNRIRKVGTNGIITTVAGSETADYSGDGGPAISAGLSYPCGLVFDASGNLFIADSDHDCVGEVVAQGPSFGLTNVSFTNAGNYDVVITSPYGSVTSSIVTLTVALPPLQATLTAGKNLSLQLNGTAGQTYILQDAASLKAPENWQPIFTNAADVNGNWTFTNSTLSGQSLFFRVTVP